MSTIFLLRHGETQWNKQKRVQGHGDSPLTLKGIAQARAYGRTLAALLPQLGGDVSILSSPLPRCLQTTSILCETAGLDYAKVEQDGRLREVSTGKWSGSLKADLPPDQLGGQGESSWFFRCPGGETYQHMAERLSSWLAEYGQTGKTYLVISHGVAGRMIRGLYLGLTPDQAIAGDSPQDSFFRLHAGTVTAIPCLPDPAHP